MLTGRNTKQENEERENERTKNKRTRERRTRERENEEREKREGDCVHVCATVKWRGENIGKLFGDDVYDFTCNA